MLRNTKFRYLISALLTGLFLLVSDALLNGNEYASGLMKFYKPLARETFNMAAGIAVDFLYGFVISALYLAVSPVIPFHSPVTRGLIFGLSLWFFRVFMYVVSQNMMLQMPRELSCWLLISGAAQMFMTGIINAALFHRKIIRQK